MRSTLRPLAVLLVIEGAVLVALGTVASRDLRSSVLLATLSTTVLAASGIARIAAGVLTWDLRSRRVVLALLLLSGPLAGIACPLTAASLVLLLVGLFSRRGRAAFEARAAGATAADALAGDDHELAAIISVFDEDPATDDPRGLCDDDLARAVIACLPGGWSEATFTVTPSPHGDDVFDVEIRGVDGSGAEPDRNVAHALGALDDLLRFDGQSVAGTQMRVWREGTWRFRWTVPPG